MNDSGSRISGVEYDVKAGVYRGDVVFFGPRGVHQIRVSTPGDPRWGYSKTLAALTAAGQHARDAGSTVAGTGHA